VSRAGVVGTIYLLHFNERYYGEDMVIDHTLPITDPANPPMRPRREWAGSLHYIGWCTNLKARLLLHERGEGSRHVSVMIGKGIHFQLARTWEGDKNLERRLKKRGSACRICPMCKVSKVRET